MLSHITANIILPRELPSLYHKLTDISVCNACHVYSAEWAVLVLISGLIIEWFVSESSFAYDNKQTHLPHGSL
jgi:hypothetical protein